MNRLRIFLAVLGMAVFLEGLPYLLFPKKTKEVLEEIQQYPPNILRGIGFVLLLLGLLLTYLGRRALFN